MKLSIVPGGGPHGDKDVAWATYSAPFANTSYQGWGVVSLQTSKRFDANSQLYVRASCPKLSCGI
jgi:hypothetical protein